MTDHFRGTPASERSKRPCGFASLMENSCRSQNDPKADIQDEGDGQHMNRAFSPEFIPRTSNPGSCRKRSSAASSPVANCGNATSVCPVSPFSSHHTSAPQGPLSFVSTYTAAMSATLMRCSTCLGALQTISSSAVTFTMNRASGCFIPLTCLVCSSLAMSANHPSSVICGCSTRSRNLHGGFSRVFAKTGTSRVDAVADMRGSASRATKRTLTKSFCVPSCQPY